MLRQALELDGPAAVRYARGLARQVPIEQVGSGLSARRVRAGDGEVCILAVGRMLEAAEEAAEILRGDGVDATVWDVRVVKPLDPEMIADAARHRLVVTVEDGVRIGGAGSHMADAIADADDGRHGSRVVVLGIPDRFIPQAKPQAILTQLGLDGSGIAASVLKALRTDSPV